MDEAFSLTEEGRSPYGERGLKFEVGQVGEPVGEVALLTESVD